MGHEIRRALRDVLPPTIKGLMRAVALEIADDAWDDSRLSKDATLENLAKWTATPSTATIRDALKRLAAAGWEFRVPIGTGRDGRRLYAVPGIAVKFKVPEFELPGQPRTGEATPAKGEPGLPLADPKGESPLPRRESGLPQKESPLPRKESGLPPSPSTPTSSLSLTSVPGTAEEIVRRTIPADTRETIFLLDEEIAPFVAWATERYKPAHLGWWLTLEQRKHLATHVAAWQAAQREQTSAVPSLPEWCRSPECDEHTRTREGADGRHHRCPACHPASLERPA